MIKIKRKPLLRIILTIFIFTILINIFPSQAKQKYPTTYWGLFADFRTEDLVRINAWDMIGKKGWFYDWGIVANPSLDLEIGNIACILDTEDPNVKKVGFTYSMITVYTVDYNEINWAVHLMTPHPTGEVWSITQNNKCFPLSWK